MTFDLKQYLERIGLELPVASEQAQLAALQRGQLMAIPFENTDPLLGRLPDLSPEGTWRKTVLHRRGGYCLELNGLLGRALGILGFRFVSVLGRVRMGAAVGGPRTHLAHLVEASGQTWLCDAGFGGPAPAVPVSLDAGTAVATRWGTFRIRHDTVTGEEVLERETPEGWFSLYGFDRSEVTEADVAEANIVCATSDQSPFPNNLMMNRVTKTGRISLFNRAFHEVETGFADCTLASVGDLADVLVHRFGLPEDPSRDHAIWERIGQPSELRRTA